MAFSNTHSSTLADDLMRVAFQILTFGKEKRIGWATGFELDALSGRLSPPAEILSGAEGALAKNLSDLSECWSGRQDLNL